MLTGNPVAGLWEAAPWRGQADTRETVSVFGSSGGLVPEESAGTEFHDLRLHSWLDLYLDTTAGG